MNKRKKEYQIIESSSYTTFIVEDDARPTAKFLSTNRFVFATNKSNQINLISGELNPDLENIFQLLQENDFKENFYVKAIQNLKKQKEYVNLMYQVSNDLISEEEFNNELEENENKYLIKLDQELNNTSFKIISKIISRIGDDVTDDEVSELFSIKSENIKNLILSKNLIANEEGT